MLPRAVQRVTRRLASSSTSSALEVLPAAALARPADVPSPLDVNAHRSDAQARIAAVPPIAVPSGVAMCDGGGGATGHPIEFIKLDKRAGASPETCKYCGLRYVMSGHGHHH